MTSASKRITPKQEVSSADTAPQRLSELADLPDSAVQRLVARNSATPPQTLEALSHRSDKAIRKAVAGNPNSPAETLTRLGAQFPLDLLRNPALDWLLLENPNILSQMPEDTQGAIAKREDLTPEMLKHLATAGKGKSLLLALLQNGNTPPEAVRKLYETAPENLAERFEMPEDQVRKILPTASFHIGLMPEPSTEKAYEMFWAAISEVYCLDKSDWSLFQVAAIPEVIKLEILAWRVFSSWLDSSYQYDFDYDYFPSLKNDFPPTFIEVLAVTAKNKRQLTALGKLANAPQWLKGASSAEDAIKAISDHARDSRLELDRLLQLNSNLLNLFLAVHPLAAEKLDIRRVLAELSHDLRPEIVAYVADQPSTPPQILAEMKQRHYVKDALPIQKYSNEKVLYGLAGNPNTPSSILEELGLVGENAFKWSFDFDIKENVARNPNTPVSVLSRMAEAKDYENSWVKFGLAQNPNTLPELFEKLSHTKDNLILTRLAENPGVPPSVLEILARGKDEEVLELLAKNPNTPESAIALIARTDDDWTLESVAVHPNVPAEVLGKLVKKNLIYDEKILRQIAGNPKTPVDALNKLARKDDPSIKKAVSTNPSTPIELLQTLCDDDASSVRSAAKAAIKARKANTNK